MRILITGGAGHIGSRLAGRLLVEGHEVIVADDLSCGYIDNVPDDAKFIEGDLALKETWLKVEACGPIDRVYHLAAYAAECLSPFVRAYNYQSNLLPTAHAINFCIKHRVPRLIYTSSAAVYGEQAVPFSELYKPAPVDPYGVAKMACERDIWIAGCQHGLDWCIVRPHNVYGPGQSLWQRYRNVFGIWFSQLFQGKPITVFGDGTQRRAFVYIDDVERALIKAATSRGASRRVHNIGGGTPISLRAAAELFARMFDAEITYLVPRHEVKDVWCATQSARVYLDFVESIELESGLRMMHDWAYRMWQAYPERRAEPQIATQIELHDGLPPSWAAELTRD